MRRDPPRLATDDIERYTRTYVSLLRSSGEVLVRGVEEAHIYSESALHEGARDPRPDVAAFAYSAGRLPACMIHARLVVMGQSHESFEQAGLPVREWPAVRARGRRRPMRSSGDGTVAMFVASVSDIDDLVPILAAWQIEWNKMHHRLAPSDLGRRLAASAGGPVDVDRLELARVLDIDAHGVEMLEAALAGTWDDGLRELARRPSDLAMRLLSGSFSQYQRAAQRWWSDVEPLYVRERAPKRRPVYFVSSNTHSLVNLLGGYARTHRAGILTFARERDPEGLAAPLEEALRLGDEAAVSNLTYYLLRAYLREGGTSIDRRVEEVQRWEEEGGIRTHDRPGQVDVGIQLFELARLIPERLDPRVVIPGLERLRASDAVIINIDYPLGMAAYHHLSRLAQGAGELRGVYVMGKAATLNGRVGDVSISATVHDEHSRNTYLFKNALSAADVQPYMREGIVLDNQRAVTVRGAFLQNRAYMGAFYREGYTVLEMEAGPYLSAVRELVSPTRHPENEIVNLCTEAPFDVGFLHYASDTPYSRRQSLLSKSLSFFGVDSTYACAIAITRRILAQELTV
ncbi:MAG: hypothetical protein KIT58_14505 [Planctomycetota bacterium]|nr:hypothetical protein [Planctomycetota bacterium]